jgi:hypothetical protein
MDWTELAQNKSSGGFCEHGNEPLGSISVDLDQCRVQCVSILLGLFKKA